MTKSWRRSVPSLRAWSLRNFKSVVKTDLPLAPLTLIVGANSAGKSSLLQSILLMAQAASERTPGGFPLNGPLVGLGTFGEARSDFPALSDVDMCVGGSLCLPFSMRFRRHHFARDIEIQEGEDTSAEAGKPENFLSWMISLHADPDTSGALVRDSKVTVHYGDELLGDLIATERAPLINPPPMLSSQRDLYSDRYTMQESIRERTPGEGDESLLRTLRPATSGPQRIEYEAVTFEAGIPVNGLTRTDEVTLFLDRVNREASDYSDFLMEDSKIDANDDPEFAVISSVSADEALDRLASLLLERCLLFVDSRRRGAATSVDLNGRDAVVVHLLISREDYSDTIRPQLWQRLSDKVGGSRDILSLRNDAHRGMRLVSPDIPEYFLRSVLYLGPLREDPRVTYPHAIASSTHMPLGRKGESTASVLLQSHAGGRRSAPSGIGWPVSYSTNARYPLPDNNVAVSLESAVNAWIKEFGLGKTLGVQDEARHGVGFTIDSRDLTSVGTGVSQILPVIVLCLMARPGQLVLLEQPELHLNPGLQQHLGDFFLAMVRSGRQLIVETHSEYIVTRLRRRVAEDTHAQVHNLFNIVFASQNDERMTEFQVIDVDQSGALGTEEWPKGFFDQAGDDVDAMMRVALNGNAHSE